MEHEWLAVGQAFLIGQAGMGEWSGTDEEAAARATVLTLLARRVEGATICPSEAARALAEGLGGKDWRDEMAAVHAAVDELVKEGAVRLSWRGEARAERTGAYRIGRAEAR